MTRRSCHNCRMENCNCFEPKPKLIDEIPSFAPDLAFSDESFNAVSFQALAAAEECHFWFTERRKLLLWALNRYFPRASRFLEIGCGAGYVLKGVAEAYPNMVTAGSELLVPGLKLADARLPENIALYQADARNLPFSDEWDVIGAFDVIEHIEQDETVLREMYRACRKGGGVILSVPQHPWLWSEADTAAHHVRRYRASEFSSKIEAAGFRIIRKTSFISLLLPALIAIRRAPGAKPYDLVVSLHISRFANIIGRTLLAIERWLIKASIDLPAGGSLLIIAVKD